MSEFVCSGKVRLMAMLVIVSVIWLGILPAIARTNHFQTYKTFLEERQINPEAMYYSDLDVMNDIQIRLSDAWQDESM